MGWWMGGRKKIGRVFRKEENLLRLNNTYAFPDESFKDNLALLRYFRVTYQNCTIFVPVFAEMIYVKL